MLGGVRAESFFLSGVGVEKVKGMEKSHAMSKIMQGSDMVNEQGIEQRKAGGKQSVQSFITWESG